MSDSWQDVHDLQQLKYRYLRTLDLKQWAQFEDCFLPEATADYAGLVFEDRASLVEYMRENLGPSVITMHHVHHPEITVDGDEATAQWYLEDRVLVPDFDYALEGAAFYTDSCRRTPQGWRISHTGYRRTFEVSMSTKDLATWKLTRGTAYDA